MSNRTNAALIALAVLAAGAGFAAGMAFGPTVGEAQPLTESADGSAAVLARLDELSRQVSDLRGAVGRSPAEEPPAARRERVAVAPGTRTPRAEADAEAVDAAPFRADVLERLAAIEQRLAALALADARGGREALTRPPGVATKDFFRVLKKLDGDVVKAAHRLWTEEQVRKAYGSPDTIVNHGEYVEWIYRLEPGKQFDFHFEGGLCTVAH